VVTIIFVRIELIVPVVEGNPRIPNLALPILAGLSPTDVEISFTDNLWTLVDLEKGLKEVDPVGIADAYRKKGIPVVLGGIHPTALPEEAKEHTDRDVWFRIRGGYWKNQRTPPLISFR
jgi:hypothetical protein